MSQASDGIVFFGDGFVPPDAADPAEVGNKAAHLIELSRLGLPVPPGFVLPTRFWREYAAAGERLPEGFRKQLSTHLRQLESATGTFYGGGRRPLLVSVRSGAPVSMPGMMATVLDVGLNDVTVQALVRRTGNPRLAWDCYRRLVATYAEVVLGCRTRPFEKALETALAEAAVSDATELDAPALEALTRELLALVRSLSGRDFPQDPMVQLSSSVEAVLRSWRSEKALAYRRSNGLDESCGTAVAVQAMAFGNAGPTSGAGVGFTRDPATGANELYLDFAWNAQGEDVVSGRRALAGARSLERALPEVWAELLRVKAILESKLEDLQDFEFTVEQGRLYLLQTRAGKRTPWAALRIAVDLVREGILSPAAGLRRLEGLDLDTLERLRLAPGAGVEPLAHATPASLGVAVGAIALDVERAQAMAAAGRQVILVRHDTDTADFEGMAAATGILTRVGGRTSHAAVVARQLGKVCLVGCGDLAIDLERRGCRLGGQDFAEGDALSLDGDGGAIYAGTVPVVHERPSEALAEVARW